VFVISGLWHGANWTFIIWGFLHGLYLIVEKLVQKLRELKPQSIISKIKMPTVIKQLFTAVLVLIGWVFFRAGSIKDAFYVLKNLSLDHSLALLRFENINLGLDKYDEILLAISVVWLFAVDGYKYYFEKERIINRDLIKVISTAFLILFIVLFGYYGHYNPTDFIYFQF